MPLAKGDGRAEDRYRKPHRRRSISERTATRSVPATLSHRRTASRRPACSSMSSTSASTSVASAMASISPRSSCAPATGRWDVVHFVLHLEGVPLHTGFETEKPAKLRGGKRMARYAPVPGFQALNGRLRRPNRRHPRNEPFTPPSHSSIIRCPIPANSGCFFA